MLKIVNHWFLLLYFDFFFHNKTIRVCTKEVYHITVCRIAKLVKNGSKPAKYPVTVDPNGSFVTNLLN